jgi:hypothetical protein
MIHFDWRDSLFLSFCLFDSHVIRLANQSFLGYLSLYDPVTIGMLVLVIFQSLWIVPTYSKAKWKFKWKQIMKNKNIFIV